MSAFLVAASVLAAVSATGGSRCGSSDEPLRIRLTIASDIFQPAAPTIRHIVDDVWRREGLMVEWVDGRIDGWAGADLWIAAIEGMTTPSGVIGVVHFNGDVPSPVARISIDGAIAWVLRHQRARLQYHVLERSLLQLSDVARLVDHALGYAAAHEIGHFVLGSKKHSAHGLMQDAYRHPDALLDQSNWRLDDRHRALLRERLSRGRVCATDLVSRAVR